MQSLKKAERWLVAGERAALTLLVGFMVALAFTQVALRQIGLRTGTGLSLLWGDQLLRHLVLWVGFLGAGVAAATDKQFAMDAAAHLFSGRAKARAAVACHLFAAWVCLALAKASTAFLMQERANARVLFHAFGLEVLEWWLEMIAPIGFTLLLLHYGLKTALAAWAAFGPAAEEKPT